MNILVIFNKRASRPFNTSIEDRDKTRTLPVFDPETGETTGTEEKPFVSSYSTDSNRFTVKSVSCSKEVFEKLSLTAGTLEAAALIETASSPQFEGRLNVYIENGSLKIA